jgi:DNA helicase II / ATP-dependent DNA helicase PcrA
METFYERKYESERLINQLKGQKFSETKKYHQQSTKVAYVGLSRPTHLLCVAIHINRINGNEPDIERNGWLIDKSIIQ